MDRSGGKGFRVPKEPGSPLTPSSSAAADALSKETSLVNFVWDDFWKDDSSSQPSMLGSKSQEELYNIFRVPLELERVLGLIFLILLDHLLFLFSVVPLRALLFVPLSLVRGVSLRRASEIVKLVIICIVTLVLSHFFDFGAAYHNIKLQSTIKIYVIINVLEVVDKVFACFGNEIFELLNQRTGECVSSQRTVGSFVHLAFFAFVACVYSLLHSLILFYQWVTLSVAINFSNSALITVLVSNNFMELKSQVFKRVSPENLVQLTYGDGVERLQLVVFLIMITFHNLSDLGWNRMSVMWESLQYLPLVLGSEVAVDWFKHGFTIKFNSLSASYYSEGSALLIRDFLSSAQSSCTNLQNAAHRVGFVDVPLAVIILKFMLEAHILSSWKVVICVFSGLFLLRTLTHMLLTWIAKSRVRRKLFRKSSIMRDLDVDLQRNSAAAK